MKKILLLLASAGLLVLLMIYVSWEKNSGIKLRIDNSSYMEDISITQKNDGVLKWVLNASRAVFLNKNDVQLIDLKVLFPEKGLTLTSDGGTYNMENRDFTVAGHIKASTKDYDIAATTLFWDSAKNELFSDKKVAIVGKRFVIEGNNLDATADKATMTHDVKAVFHDN